MAGSKVCCLLRGRENASMKFDLHAVTEIPLCNFSVKTSVKRPFLPLIVQSKSRIHAGFKAFQYIDLPSHGRVNAIFYAVLQACSVKTCVNFQNRAVSSAG